MATITRRKGRIWCSLKKWLRSSSEATVVILFLSTQLLSSSATPTKTSPATTSTVTSIRKIKDSALSSFVSEETVTDDHSGASPVTSSRCSTSDKSKILLTVAAGDAVAAVVVTAPELLNSNNAFTSSLYEDMEGRKGEKDTFSPFPTTTTATTVPHMNSGITKVNKTDVASITKQKNPVVVPSNIHQNYHILRGGGVGSRRNRSFNSSLHGRCASSVSLIILIKIVFFFYYASLGILFPYLPVYYDSLGHDGQVIGYLGAVKPATTFLIAPIWGVVSDMYNSHTVLQSTFVLSVLLQLCVMTCGATTNLRYLLFIVFLTAFINTPVKSLLDALVLQQLPKRQRNSYGRLRLYGQLGFGVGSSLGGVLLSITTKSSNNSSSSQPLAILHFLKHRFGLSGYRLLFALHGILSIPTYVGIRAFGRYSSTNSDGNSNNNNDSSTRTKKKSLASSLLHRNKTSKKKKVNKITPATSENNSNGTIGGGLRLLLMNPDAVIFFGLVLVVGISSGIIENFAYVRMREVGGDGRIMGLSRLVSSLAGAPMFYLSGYISQRLRADTVLLCTLASYVARFVVYATAPTASYMLPAEALRGVTFAMFWSVATLHAYAISPKGLSSTLLLILNALYGGLGQSLGAVLGGKLQFRFGTQTTFSWAATADTCFLVLVSIYLYVWRPATSLNSTTTSCNVSSFSNPIPITKKRSKRVNEKS